MSLHRRIGGIALALLFFWTSQAAFGEEQPSTIRFGSFGLGYGKQAGTQLMAIAQEKGFVAAELGTTPPALEWEYLAGTGPAVNEAIADGQLDFAQYGSLPSIIGRANGLPIKIVLSCGGTNIYAAVRTALPIQTIRDLKGHTVTVQKATILHWSLLETLKANGLADSDVTILDLKAADQLAALAAGSADASFGTSSLLELRDQGLVRIVYSSQLDDPRATGPNGFVVTDAFAAKYPETTERVVRGFIRAAQWASQPENREEVLRIWSKSGVAYDALREDNEHQSLHDVLDPRIDDFFRSQYQAGIDFAKQQKLIRQDVDLSQWIDTKYQDAAFASLNLVNYWPARSPNGAIPSN